MTAGETGWICATSDAADRLIAAEEPLAGLQLRCGGELPGTIAVPALLETVRKARRYQLKLARALQAQDGENAIAAWAEVQPRRDGEPGCEILLRNWQTTPLPAESAVEIGGLQQEIDRHVAELTARLDAGQRVLTVAADASDLADLAAAMQAGAGRPWTEFVAIEGSSHRQPLHWRLLDGAALSVPGSDRNWRATLLPQQSGGGEPSGFELLLTARQPLRRSTMITEPPPREPPAPQFGTIGREIAPVLRQPIARIIANAETIRTRLAGPLAKEYADYAADIAAAGQHLLGLVDDLADLEVVEAEDFATAAERIDLAEVARQAAAILGVRASEKRIVVETPVVEDVLPALAEFRRVLQILLNLIGNAIRYSPEGSRIRILLSRDDQRARVTVADEGPGLSPQDQARVFEKFERLGRSGDGGSGLGLYIARRLARAMGGDLTVAGAPGEGARFTLDLPGEGAAGQPGYYPDRRNLLHLPRIPGLGANGSAPAGEPDENQPDRS